MHVEDEVLGLLEVSMRATVLLIEDNDQNAYLVKVLLDPRGYLVLRATDGPSGLHLARSYNPGLILLDIHSPKMDGYRVARSLRQLEALRSSPIIALTSYAMMGDREKALESGCTGDLQKPINHDIFVAEVERNLNPVPNQESP